MIRFLVAVLCALPLAASTIDFDTLATNGGPVALTNQYAAQGVLFINIAASQQFKFNITPASAPNYASPFFSNLNPGTIEFVSLANPALPAVASTVSFDLLGLTSTQAHPGNYSGATLDALDASGNVIPGLSVIIPAESSSTVDQILSFSNISGLRFTQTPGTSGALPFDNLNVGTLTSTPEPSSLVLLSSALAMLVGRRVRLGRRTRDFR